jgi:hypothetical protein
VETTDRIKKAVIKYYLKKKRCVNEEIGLCKRGRLRADLFVQAMNGYSIVVECKSGLPDFKTDNDAGKWKGYLKYCHQFYWAMTLETYKKVSKLIEPGCGVIIVDVDTLKVKFAKKARVREMKLKTQFELAMRVIFRNSDHNRLKTKRKASTY